MVVKVLVLSLLLIVLLFSCTNSKENLTGSTWETQLYGTSIQVRFISNSEFELLSGTQAPQKTIYELKKDGKGYDFWRDEKKENYEGSFTIEENKLIMEIPKDNMKVIFKKI